MKNILFGLFVLPFQFAYSQYYYKDIVTTRETNRQYAQLTAAGVRKVELASFDGNSNETAGFSAGQTIDPAKRTILSTTTTAVIGNSFVLATYNANGQLISTNDSTQEAVTKTAYEYDAEGRLTRLTSNSKSDNITNSETHTYQYNPDGTPKNMTRIRNNSDTSLIEFLPDEKGLVGEEKTIKSAIPVPAFYYYHDASGRLTDVVRFNPRASRLLPYYMFEYSPEGQLKKMTLVPAGTSDYQVWYYQYEQNGLKKMDLCYNKQQELLGKVVYSYSK
ncbi:hypothetical protein [Flavihumibacter petaseus]|uniref:Rhs family protein n=1 Tax=Flavihumibacter petaseus NBRC 106054 TaxID=1220578 RepID=A0A0E9MZH5_9BACT|nr:hypothetical protein [Flavihumibacter petaseus]GAO43152.1 hypothetical protein FPE01S_02_02560 [Flavihumibacter petaseus NBRC 106054]